MAKETLPIGRLSSTPPTTTTTPGRSVPRIGSSSGCWEDGMKSLRIANV